MKLMPFWTPLSSAYLAPSNKKAMEEDPSSPSKSTPGWVPHQNADPRNDFNGVSLEMGVQWHSTGKIGMQMGAVQIGIATWAEKSGWEMYGVAGVTEVLEVFGPANHSVPPTPVYHRNVS